MAKVGSKADIHEHLTKMLDAKIADGTIVPDATAAAHAASLPAFSAGTMAMDEQGRIKPPAGADAAPTMGGEQTIELNPSTQLDAEAGAAQEASAAGAKVAPRDPDTGKFSPQAKPSEGTPKAAPPAPRTEESRSESVDAAAGAILDEWDDVEYEGDGGAKYTVRAKKADAENVRRGFMRRANYDRAMSYTNKYRSTLEPLIVDGRLEPIMPLMQRALQDEEFGAFVVEAYNRRIAGQPLTQQQAQVLQAVTQPQANSSVPAEAIDGYGLESDPWLAQAIGPIATQMKTMQSRMDAQDQARQTEDTRQRASYAQQQQQAQQIEAAHMDLVRRYPNEFSGDLNRDNARLQPIFKYAQEAGYVQAYGLQGAIVLAAQAIAEERAYGGSPAAGIVQQIDRATMAAAQSQAGAARSVGGGAPVVTARRARPVARPEVNDANGKRKPPRQYAEEIQRYNEAVAAQG